MRSSWPPPVSLSPTRPSTTHGGLELGLMCELALAEMHVDKALAPSLVGRPGGAAADAAAAAGSSSAAPAPKAPAASDKTTALSSAGGAAMVATGATASTAAVKAPSGAGASGGGGADKSSSSGSAANGTDKSQESVRRSVESGKRREARRHLSIADLSMMQLEPFFHSWDDDEVVEAGERKSSSRRRPPQRGGDYGDGESAAGEGLLEADSHVPWALVVRWRWLRGLRARHAGEVEEALKCFRRCERALRVWDEEEGRGGEGEGEEQEHSDKKTAVVLPYCVVNPRIDVQVSKHPGFHMNAKNKALCPSSDV